MKYRNSKIIVNKDQKKIQSFIHPSAKVHSTVILDENVYIGANVSIGPWSVIGPGTLIGDNTEIKSHVVIARDTKIGKNNKIFQFSSIGEDCQDLKYNGESTVVVIGDNNIIREYSTIHRGSVGGNGITKVGNNNFLMSYTHVAHDCQLADNIIMANNATLGGHVSIGHGVILAGFSKVHQFCRIHSFSMAAVGATILKDVPAFMMVSGTPAKVRCMNFEGMRRRGYSSELIKELKKCYRIIYRQHLSLKDAINVLNEMSGIYEVDLLIKSLKNSKRGIIR